MTSLSSMEKKTSSSSIEKDNLESFMEKKTSMSSVEKDDLKVFNGERRPQGLLWRKKTSRSSMEKKISRYFMKKKPQGLLKNKISRSTKEDLNIFMEIKPLRSFMEEEGFLLFDKEGDLKVFYGIRPQGSSMKKDLKGLLWMKALKVFYG